MPAAAQRRYDDVPPAMILWGGTSQSKVLRPIIEFYSSKVVAIFDDKVGLPSPFGDVELIGGWTQFLAWAEGRDLSRTGFSVAIGNDRGLVRVSFHERLSSFGLIPVTLVHPSSVIAESATIGAGCQILAGAIIGVEARVGRQCLINTRASVDHECVLEDGTTVSPGVTLCGGVHLGEGSWVCSGATVLPDVRVGRTAIVGAGALVRKDVPDGVTVIGIPSRELIRRNTHHE